MIPQKRKQKIAEARYYRPLGQLPEGENPYILTSVGKVDYAYGSNEPVWDCTFTPVVERRFDRTSSLSIGIGSSIICCAAVGSIWQNQSNIGFIGWVWPRNLHCEMSDQIVLFRKSKDGIFPLVFSGDRNPGDTPYILIPLLGEIDADYALVSCPEVYRYYYGYLPSVSRHFFSFDMNGNNAKLFNSKSTGWVDNGIYQIDPKPAMTDMDQERFANYHASATARSAIGKAASSARAQFNRKEEVRPIVQVPISGINEWVVAGSVQEVLIDISGKKGERNVIAVTRILDCLNASSVKKVESLRAIRTRRSRTDPPPPPSDTDYTPPPIPNPGGKVPPVVSDEKPGTQKLDEPELEAEAFFHRASWKNIAFEKKGVKRALLRTRFDEVDHNDIDFVSTQDEGGGADNIAPLGDYIPRPRKPKKDPNAPEVRDLSEGIFDNAPEHSITSKPVSVEDLPKTLKYCFESVSVFLEENKGTQAWFLGGPSKVFYPDKVYVYLLPAEWGPEACYRKSPDKVRRALVCEIPTNTGNVYIFDLEKKGGEKIAMHAMLFTGRSLSRRQIGIILFKRLKGNKKGWPARHQYSGDFWTMPIGHYKEISESTKGNLISQSTIRLELARQNVMSA